MKSGIISIFILSIVACLEKKRKSTVYIYAIWSIAVYIVYIFFSRIFVPFSNKYWIVFLVFITCFYLSYKLIVLFFMNSKVYKKSIKFKGVDYKVLFVIAFAAATLTNTAHLGIILKSSYHNLRELILSGGLKTSPVIANSLMCALMYLTNITNKPKKTKILVACYLFITAILSTTKIFTVIAILYIVPWYNVKFKITIRTVAITAIIGIAGFAVVNVYRGNIVGEYSTVWGNILYTCTGYLCGGLAAFQSILDGALLDKNGWIWTGKWYGNVYTMFYNIYFQNSIIIFMFKSILIGCLYGVIDKESVFNNYLRIYGLYPLFFMYFGMMFSVRQWIVFIMAGLIMRVAYNGEIHMPCYRFQRDTVGKFF